MSAYFLQWLHGRVLMVNLPQKFDFRSAFNVTITDADIGSIKFSPYISVDKYMDHMLEKFEKKIVWYEIYKILNFLA